MKSTQKMKRGELAQAMSDSFHRLYSAHALGLKFVKTWHNTRSLITALWAFFSNCNYRRVALRKPGKFWLESPAIRLFYKKRKLQRV